MTQYDPIVNQKGHMMQLPSMNSLERPLSNLTKVGSIPGCFFLVLFIIIINILPD